MRLSIGDMLRLHLENLDALDWLLLLLLAAEIAAIVWGTVLLVRHRFGPFGPRRWSRVAISLGIVAVILAVANLARHYARLHRVIAELGFNVTPGDGSLQAVDGFLALMFGLLIAAVGLGGGWVLEWFIEGREQDPGRP